MHIDHTRTAVHLEQGAQRAALPHEADLAAQLLLHGLQGLQQARRLLPLQDQLGRRRCLLIPALHLRLDLRHLQGTLNMAGSSVWLLLVRSVCSLSAPHGRLLMLW